MNKKINLIIGIFLLILVVVVNEWTITKFFSPDGHIDDILNKIIIYIFDIFCFFSGLFLILRREVFRFKIKGMMLSSLVTILLFLVTVEIYTRRRYSYEPPSLHLQFLQQEVGERISDFIDPEAKPNGLKYYPYHLFATAPYQSKTAIFTEYFSARNVPDSYPLGDGDIIVWLFGGSTMQNLETIDKLTIANSIALNLKESGIKATVFNFGVGSFQSSVESIKFQDLLRRTSPSEKPDFVIFYDGYNDAAYTYLSGAGNIQRDLSEKMEFLITSNHPKLLVYSASNIFDKYSYLWKHYIKPRIDTMLFDPATFFDNKQNLIKGVEMYVLNTQMIRGICKELQIKPLFILQPMIYTKENPTDFEISTKESLNQLLIKFMEEFYDITREKMRSYDDFNDLSHIFDNSKRNDFYDYGHIGPYSGVDIGFHLSQIVARQVLKK